MTNDFYENISSTPQQSNEFKSDNKIYENQSTDITTCDNALNVNEDVNNNEIKKHKPSVSLDSICNVNTKAQLSLNISLNEVSFNSQKWLVTDLFSNKRRPPRQNEFLLLLLENFNYSSYITWLDKSKGTFKIQEPQQVAKLWNKVKNRHTNGHMNYETFARGIRFYYKSGQMIKTHKKHTFRFKLPLINIS